MPSFVSSLNAPTVVPAAAVFPFESYVDVRVAPPVTLVPAMEEPAAQALVTQFTAAQGQMFDQFQQSMLMMMKTMA